ncbi:DnaJ C-terminal domain-containing protein [Altererythrobacter sp. Root672]|uniref:DnaJ C-terminal domain-containing protein n=1 Tax=Altererythrobacter sp. Root672 TaxID=1736584 RepID=UPI0006F4D382|nr:DnaJ C-terminal domain-containing protein [Altererythrobacter sp. Root672]KRA81506.1 molecular chaperone DnaJ [Altererythrobacter sp. Root672]
MADPYSTLGVQRGANEKDIKSAYRKLAKELHPDRNQDNPKASERFAEVTRAYDLLSDKDKRAKFDRGEIDADGNPAMPFGGAGGFRPRPGGGSQGYSARDFQGFGAGEETDISDLFEGLFGRGSGGFGARGEGPGGMGGGFGGRRQAPPQRGSNTSYRLKVPFVDAAALKPQRITLSTGNTIDLKLPAGVEDGTQMRLKGKGNPGPAGAGDALVTVVVEPHAFYTRDGDDVRLDLPITLDEAVRGAKVKVPTVEGPVMLTIVPGSNSGKVLRLKGRGFSNKNGGRGDQLVRLEIQLPEDLSSLTERLDGWSDGTGVRNRLGV